jgi:hypothetical protein
VFVFGQVGIVAACRLASESDGSEKPTVFCLTLVGKMRGLAANSAVLGKFHIFPKFAQIILKDLRTFYLRNKYAIFVFERFRFRITS